MQFSRTNMIPNQKQQIQNIPPNSNTSVRQQEHRARQETTRQQPILPVIRQRYRTYSEIERDHKYWKAFGFPEYMDEVYSDTLLEAYEWEQIYPKERWEQEQLNEFQGFAAIEQLHLMEGEIQQQNQINEAKEMPEEEQEETNQQLI
ncbi:unnamed protein product [Didymodactylos carnosus]|uniref:Uncharacterized protein n=1 Tax=Didymodactylos carnosus TaxID=1234261 RepID=A0A816BI04_9BILA|nr:unnamed protein product [Didymodactylos carnosus]CAF1610670.1 unnamed protein product [Didymodactylos carnosus]CAF4349037.1 unnamed protein product [Didymodactylos carnosus]CAF4493530.1 unnamed protein product [Didymodactylos carnosus]